MSIVLASAADARYGAWLLNLVGSVRRRSDLFDRIVLFDLGLSPFQRRLAAGIHGAELATVPLLVPHMRQGRTWKTWIWANVHADVLVWLDAGITVLRPLTDLVDQASEHGYFVVSQGVANRECIPSDYYSLLDVPRTVGDKDVVASGILAFRRESVFFDEVILPTFDAARRGLSLGFSASEAQTLNRGLDRMDEVVVRDCPLFRHEQTLLNVFLYKALPDAHVNDLDRFAGFRSAHDHPQQVIWSHRRRGDYRYLWRVPYRFGTAVTGIPWGMYIYLRERARHLRWVLRPSVHRHLVQRALRRGARP